MATPTDREIEDDFKRLETALDRATKALDRIEHIMSNFKNYPEAIRDIEAVLQAYNAICGNCGGIGCPGPSAPNGCEYAI